jgi:siroheme synthase (precorrin-2 oxidase/ferrochelatase)
LQEKLLAEGREEFVGKWETLLVEQANMALVASELTPAMKQLIQSGNNLFKEEGLDFGELWLDAISEAHRIQNQPASDFQHGNAASRESAGYLP